MTTITKTVQELRQEAEALLAQAAAAEEAARAEAQRQKEEAARLAKEEADKVERAKVDKIKTAIVQGVKGRLPGVSIKMTSSDAIEVADTRLWQIDINRETEGDSWRRRYTGNYTVTIGEYGSRVTYKPRKDGTHNYEKIADRLVDIYKAQSELMARRAAAENNQEVVNKLRAETGLRYGELDCSETDGKPCKLNLSWSTWAVEEEKARAIAELWAEFKSQANAIVKG